MPLLLLLFLPLLLSASAPVVVVAVLLVVLCRRRRCMPPCLQPPSSFFSSLPPFFLHHDANQFNLHMQETFAFYLPCFRLAHRGARAGSEAKRGKKAAKRWSRTRALDKKQVVENHSASTPKISRCAETAHAHSTHSIIQTVHIYREIPINFP